MFIKNQMHKFSHLFSIFWIINYEFKHTSKIIQLEFKYVSQIKITFKAISKIFLILLQISV